MNLALLNDDVYLDNGNNLAVVRYPESVAQAIASKLKVFLGEWFLDEEIGIPFFTEVLIKTNDKSKIDAIFKSEILKVNHVVRIEQFESEINRETRVYNIDTLFVKVSSGEIVEV